MQFVLSLVEPFPLHIWFWIQSFTSSKPVAISKFSLPYNLPIAGGKLVEFIPFPGGHEHYVKGKQTCLACELW